MPADATEPVVLRLEVTLDRTALTELAAALVPFVSQHVQRELLDGLAEAARKRPNAVELRYPAPAKLE